MQTTGSSLWLARAATLALTAATGYGVVAWTQAWRVVAQGPDPAVALATRTVQSEPAAVARALGLATEPVTAAAPAVQPQRVQLLGVATDIQNRGVALIAIDGKPARHYAVGASITEGLVLQKLLPRSAQLGPEATGIAGVTLELPALTTAQALPPTSIANPVRRRQTQPVTKDD